MASQIGVTQQQFSVNLEMTRRRNSFTLQVAKMMCEVMPTIAEDPGAAGVQGDSNFEQVMVNLLDEREKLLETLRETQEQLETNKQKVGELEKENASLQRQVNENTPQVCQARRGMKT